MDVNWMVVLGPVVFFGAIYGLKRLWIARRERTGKRE
jgi:hypothetical protein